MNNEKNIEPSNKDIEPKEVVLSKQGSTKTDKVSAKHNFKKNPQNTSIRPSMNLDNINFIFLFNCGNNFFALTIGPAINCGNNET